MAASYLLDARGADLLILLCKSLLPLGLEICGRRDGQGSGLERWQGARRAALHSRPSRPLTVRAVVLVWHPVAAAEDVAALALEPPHQADLLAALRAPREPWVRQARGREPSARWQAAHALTSKHRFRFFPFLASSASAEARVSGLGDATWKASGREQGSGLPAFPNTPDTREGPVSHKDGRPRARAARASGPKTHLKPRGRLARGRRLGVRVGLRYENRRFQLRHLG